MRIVILAAAMLLSVPVLNWPVSSSADPVIERQRELLQLLKHDCGSCHGLTLKGGIGPPLTADRLAGRSEQTIATTILSGVPNSAMPPWRPFMNDEDAAWLARQLRKGLPKRS